LWIARITARCSKAEQATMVAAALPSLLLAHCQGDAGDAQIVGLGAAGGEDQLAGAGIDGLGDRGTGLLQSLHGQPALLVQRIGIAKAIAIWACQPRQHGLQDLRPQRRRSRIVKVVSHLDLGRILSEEQ